jgi:two-component system sensor histidine kinase BaeS
LIRTLRSRLVISHILPVIIILPILGLVLAYIIETQFVLQNISAEIEQQAALAAHFAATQPDIWIDANQARIFITRLDSIGQSNIRLLDLQGKLLASNDPRDSDLPEQTIQSDTLLALQAGQSLVNITYTFNVDGEIIEVLVPVTGSSNEVIGIVRLSRQFADVSGALHRLRYLIAGSVVTALALAILLGTLIALNLERPIRQLTDAIFNIIGGQEWQTLPVKGPNEVRTLILSFNTLIEKLRTLEETRRRLLANIVHEVSRPIGAVQAAIHALRTGADEEPELRRELLEGIDAQLNRLHPLLDNLAKLHETILGTLELQRQPTDLSQWLPVIANSWREAAHEKGLHWEIDIPPTMPVVNVDPDRLAQVFGNLLSNAIKYTPAGGKVSVTAGTGAERIWIKISDTGSGIATAELVYIFEPFYRSQRTQRFPQGMGLGLTIAHDLVQAHGGQLTVDSTPGKGSQFTVWLPTNQPVLPI